MPALTISISDEMMRHFYKRGKPSWVAKQYLEDRMIAEDIKEIKLIDEEQQKNTKKV